MSDLPSLPEVRLGRYRHYKGGEYEVIGVARHSETHEPLVVYRPLYHQTGLWVRPCAMFFEQVEQDGRPRPRFSAIVESRLPQRLETARLVLRRPTEADAMEIFRSYTQDALVCRFMVWRPHSSVVETQAFIASCVAAWEQGSRLPYVITEAGSPSAIGMLEARIQGLTVDLGYVLARAHWGKGYMPEAAAALAAAAFERGHFRVQAFCNVGNIPSQRTLEKAGFAREGRLERYMVHPNISAEPRPCFMYSRCR